MALLRGLLLYSDLRVFGSCLYKTNSSFTNSCSRQHAAKCCLHHYSLCILSPKRPALPNKGTGYEQKCIQ